MEQENIGTRLNIQKIIFSKEFLFVSSIVFSSYEILGMSLTYVLLGIYVVFIWFIRGKRFILLDKSFLFFMMVLLVHEILMIFVHSNDAKTIINNIIGAIIAVAIVGTLSSGIDLEKLKRAYYIIAIIVSLGLLYRKRQIKECIKKGCHSYIIKS